MMGINKLIAVLFLFVFTFYLINATVLLGNNSNIKYDYFVKEKLEGKINLSLTNEPVNTVFDFVFTNTSYGNRILIDLLKNNPGINYSCSPKDCNSDFKKEGSGELTKSFSLSAEKIIGSSINGANVNVKDFSLMINSNAQSSCQQQLSIDILGDGVIDWENNLSSGETCISETKSNCYGSGNFPSWYTIEQVPYCEKVYLGKYPAFEIKTFLKYDGQSSYSSDLLKASLYNTEKQFVGSCNLQKPLSSGSYVSCIINHVPKKAGDYYACVSLKEGASNNGYQMQARNTGELCGFLGDPSQVSSFSADYNIMVSSKKFGPVGSIKLNETTFFDSAKESLIGKYNTYLTDKYKGTCPQEGCVLPISFSGINQQIDLSQHSVRYSFEGSSGVEENNLYLLSKSPAKASSEYIILNLEKSNILVPDKSGNYSFKLVAGSNKIFEKEINVKGEGESSIEQVNPKIVAAANPTEFTAFINSEADTYEKLKWDFGDNTAVQDSTTNKITHTYNSIGNYTLKITSTKSEQSLDVASFKISVVSPKSAINSTLISYSERLENVEAQFEALSNKYKNILEAYGFDLVGIKFKTSELEDEYTLLTKNSNTPASEYIILMQKVVALDVPINIKPSANSSLPFIVDPEIIKVEDISSLYNDYYVEGKENEYDNEIALWAENNLNITLTHSTYSVYYDSHRDDFLSEFDYQIVPKKSLDYGAYMIILRDKNDIDFTDTYTISDKAKLTGIELDLTKTNNVKFIIEEGIDEFSLPVYFSPNLNQIIIKDNKTETKSFWSRFLIGFFIVLIITLIIYIFLQEWYKRKYQSYLFKNPSELYNLLFFIKNGKNQRFSDLQIKENLKKSGWKNEQVNYAFNKFYGKRLGMWEIPVFLWFEKRKMRREIEKRNAKKTIL